LFCFFIVFFIVFFFFFFVVVVVVVVFNVFFLLLFSFSSFARLSKSSVGSQIGSLQKKEEFEHTRQSLQLLTKESQLNTSQSKNFWQQNGKVHSLAKRQTKLSLSRTSSTSPVNSSPTTLQKVR
jgi:hypothetical protein